MHLFHVPLIGQAKTPATWKGSLADAYQKFWLQPFRPGTLIAKFLWTAKTNLSVLFQQRIL